MTHAAPTAARVLLLALLAVPLVIAFAAAFRDKTDLFESGSTLGLRTFIPTNPTFGGLSDVLGSATFRRQLLNTSVFSLLQATIGAGVAILAGYAFARFRGRAMALAFSALMATAFLPLSVVLLPMYLTAQAYGLLGTDWALFLPYVLSPLGIYLIRQAVLDLPPSLEEAVLVDGGGLWHVLTTVVWPNCRAAIVTVWSFGILVGYNQFLWPLLNSQNPDRQFVQVGIASFYSPDQTPDYEKIFAGSLVAVLPVIVLFGLVQRSYAQSLASTGLK